jgi:hypothetical protein
MKELFNEPELEVIHFEAVDIIATSNIMLDPDELPPVVVD